jgi:molybdopterin-containing oxidoreductase family molybdopterin binding subunit
MRAHRVDGVVVKIEGNPDSAVGKGRLCARGVAAIMTHYDPNRLRVPLRRTNPRKGVGVDPMWKEIGWDEALDEIAGRLKRLRQDDPRKLMMQRTTTTTSTRLPLAAFGAAFGTPNTQGSGSLHCGNGSHLVSGIMHASWNLHPDFQYCNYLLTFGTNIGFGAGTAANAAMKQAADARVRGMRTVVVDPTVNSAAAKADEWVPIRVGTDGALALALCNVMVNERKTVDLPYLKAKTNGPYLIGADGTYVRDPATGAPLVWDETAGTARPYNLARSEDMALEGTFNVGGVMCRPAFQLLREHLKKFTPEWGEQITTVPAANIRRIAGEFATAARIGSVIVIEGVPLPYRPVTALAFRGAQGHRNSTHTFLAIDLLNHLVGAADVVGAALGMNSACHGHPETGKPHYLPQASVDGLLQTGDWVTPHLPYPVGTPRNPQLMGLQDLFVLGTIAPFTESSDREELWSKFGLPYRPEILFNHGANLLMSLGNAETVAAALSKYEFIFSVDLFLTETAQFADIVLPDCDNLETFDSRSNYPFIFSLPAGMGDWCWPIRQPIVEPEGAQRRLGDICAELARRAGFLEDYNMALNFQLKLEEPYRLERDRVYSWEAVCDADLKSMFGGEHGIEWFKKHGLVAWPKKPEEVYWRPFVDARVPIYWEFMVAVGKKIAAIAEPMGLNVPAEFYEPLPQWTACAAFGCKAPGFDLYAFYSRHSLHTHGFTVENPWLDEAAQMDPVAYTVVLNVETGRRKGLKTGMVVELETEKGRTVRGRLQLIQGIHPEAIGVAVGGGHWSDGLPVAKGKGTFFNEMLELDWDHTDLVSLNQDLCVKVKVKSVEGSR